MNKVSVKKYISNTGITRYLKKNFSDSLYGMLNMMIASLDGFLLNVLLVRFLSYEDLGNYKLFFSVINMLIIFSINGLNTSVAKSIAKKYGRFFIKAIKISGLFSLIASLVLIILSVSYYRGIDVKYALLAASFMVPIYFGFNIWESFFYGERQFKKVLLLNTAIAVTRFAACGSILFFYRNYLLTIIVYLLIVSLYNLIFSSWIWKRVSKEEPRPDKDRELIKHGFKLTGASAVSVIAKNIERIILDAVSNATMVGIYSVISVFPTFIKNSLKTLVNVPTVKLAAHPEKDNRIIIKKGLYIIFSSGVILFIIFWFITPFLLKFFFKVDDPDMIRYGKLMLVPLIFMPTNLVIKYMCSYQGSGNSVLKLYTTTDIIKLAMLAIFIPLFKINGIIIALILGEFFSFLILIIWFIRTNKRFGIGWKKD